MAASSIEYILQVKYVLCDSNFVLKRWENSWKWLQDDSAVRRVLWEVEERLRMGGEIQANGTVQLSAFTADLTWSSCCVRTEKWLFWIEPLDRHLTPFMRLHRSTLILSSFTVQHMRFSIMPFDTKYANVRSCCDIPKQQTYRQTCINL
jgi:hypothetical protein